MLAFNPQCTKSTNQCVLNKNLTYHPWHYIWSDGSLVWGRDKPKEAHLRMADIIEVRNWVQSQDIASCEGLAHCSDLFGKACCYFFLGCKWHQPDSVYLFTLLRVSASFKNTTDALLKKYLVDLLCSIFLYIQCW